MRLNNHIFRLIYELSLNSRVVRKELSSKLLMSPQLVSYNIDRLKKESYISEEAIIDPAKLNLISIKIIMQFASFDLKEQNEIIKYLSALDYVVRIEKIILGADLLVEYAVPNLSFFNKLHTGFIEIFGKSINILGTYPVFVKYFFSRKYLWKNTKLGDILILGEDKQPVHLHRRSREVLAYLINYPSAPLLEISRNTGINARTVKSILKYMVNKELIRGYSVNLNYGLLKISACNVFIRIPFLDTRITKKLIQFASENREITSVVKVIGRNPLLIRIESRSDYKKTLIELRKKFKFYDYIVYDCGDVIKNTYVPVAHISKHRESEYVLSS